MANVICQQNVACCCIMAEERSPVKNDISQKTDLQSSRCGLEETYTTIDNQMKPLSKYSFYQTCWQEGDRSVQVRSIDRICMALCNTARLFMCLFSFILFQVSYKRCSHFPVPIEIHNLKLCIESCSVSQHKWKMYNQAHFCLQSLYFIVQLFHKLLCDCFRCTPSMWLLAANNNSVFKSQLSA